MWQKVKPLLNVTRIEDEIAVSENYLYLFNDKISTWFHMIYDIIFLEIWVRFYNYITLTFTFASAPVSFTFLFSMIFIWYAYQVSLEHKFKIDAAHLKSKPNYFLIISFYFYSVSFRIMFDI